MMKVSVVTKNVWIGWLLVLGSYWTAGPPCCCVQGFAYAPNFITKTIVETTGQEPLPDTLLLGGPKSPPEEEQDEPQNKGELQPITTRFPPEPNGYLHLGHAKAISFNFAVSRMFSKGKCHMRLDDTNPSKEGQEYVDSILEDVRWIQSGIADNNSDGEKELEEDKGPWFGPVRKTSDYFELIFDSAVALIQSGHAYVDSLTAEEMREYRGTLTEPGTPSPYASSRSVEENLAMFQDMRSGKYPDGTHVVRARIDMASPNLNLRDPVLYRIKHESHQATGDTWYIYPMYDFSHPISDAIEGITHSLCTLEFEDHRPLYDWTIDTLNQVAPHILNGAQPRQIEFSRLNVKYTVLSKRKLIQLVTGKHVNGWDDPRMPTLSGFRRRGVPPAALRLFCERVGISKADSNIDFGELENCIREEMDGTKPRAFCILQPLQITLSNWPKGEEMEDFEVPRHPKIPEMGDRTIPFGKNLYIERSDFFDSEGAEGTASNGRPPKGFKRLVPGGKVRLKYAYVISCDEIKRDPDTNEPVELVCSYYPETRAGFTPEGEKRVPGIIQWVESTSCIKARVNQYDRLFKEVEPGKDSGDYLMDLNPKSFEKILGVAIEPSVSLDAMAIMSEIRDQEEFGAADDNEDKLYPSQVAYQFERNGYFALDPSSMLSDLVFNRVVTLRDTWEGADVDGTKEGNDAQRNRGNKKEKQPAQNKGGGGGAGVVEDVRRIALRAGTILEAGPHPEADSLIVCQVDCGDVDDESKEPKGPRTVVAGLAGKIPLDTLVGRKIACITNLKPARMRGIESEAMLLAAASEDDAIVELLSIPDSVPNGELLSFEGKDASDPDTMLKSKGALKVWDRVKAGLRANGQGEATYVNEGETFRIMSSAGPVSTDTLVDSIIQ